VNPQEYEKHDKLEDTHWWFEGRRRVIREVLKRHLLPRSQRRILDVGCGTGGMLPMLSEVGEVEGAEYSADARERAKVRVPHFAVQPCELPHELPSGERDLITAFDVIEHLDEPIESLKAFRERLVFDGQVVVTVPAFQFLWTRHDEQLHHKRRYTRLQLVSHLSAAGLRVTFASYFNSVLFPAVAGVRMLQRMFPSRFDTGESDLEETSEPVNFVLKHVFGAERLAVGRTKLPVGVSLIAVAQRG